MTDGSPEAGPNSTPLSTANIETIPEEQKRSPSSIRKTSVDRVPEQQRRSSSSIRKTSVDQVPEEQRHSSSSIRKTSVDQVPKRISANPLQPIPKLSVLSNP